MAKLSLEDVRRAVENLALKINAPTTLLPTFGYSRDFAYPHIEVDSLGYLHFVIIERGQEFERKTTDKLDDLLYWIFESVTSEMASNFELANRIENEDSRRLMFAKREELLGNLNNAWQKKVQDEHTRILERYPFDNLAGQRATYCGMLRKQGYSEHDIDKLAYEKYPTK